MTIAAWSTDMDADLLRQRRDNKLPWRVVHIEGATTRECQKRFEFLTSGATKPVVKIATKGPDPDEDGLARLGRKRQLTPDQMRHAMAYSALGRMAELAGGPVKVSDLQQVGGGKGGGSMATDGGITEYLTAKRELFRRRFVVLAGQTDMLTVMDGVCIGRQTLMALAGGDDRRARELLAVLRVALDLLAIDASGGAKNAA